MLCHKMQNLNQLKITPFYIFLKNQLKQALKKYKPVHF